MKVKSQLIMQLTTSVFILLAIFLTFTSNTKAASTVLIPNQDITGGNYSFNNGTLTIGNGTTTISKTIRIGTTNYNNQGIISKVSVNGTLSFVSSSLNYEVAQEPLNRYGGTSVNEYNGGYFGVIVSRETSSNPLDGNGTINIVPVNSPNPNSHLLVGVVAIQGNTSNPTNVTINQLNINASGSTVRQIYNSENVEGFVGIGIGIAGNASVSLGSNNSNGPTITGAPAIMMGYGFAADDNLNGPQITNGATNLTVNSGLVTTTGIDNANQFSAIKNFGQDTGVANITVNGGTVDGGDNGAGIYCANSVSDINLNGGEIIGYSGISARAGSIVVPKNSTPIIRGIGENTNVGAGIKVDKGNGAALYLNTNSPSTVSYTGGSVRLLIDSGAFLSNNNSAIYAQAISGNNTSPISEEGSVIITGGVFMSDMTGQFQNNIQAVNFNDAAGAIDSISGGSFLPAISITDYLNTNSNGMMYEFSGMDLTGYGKTLQLAQNSLSQLNTFLLKEGMITEPLTPEITQKLVENNIESISISPDPVNLSTILGGRNTTTVTATILPVVSSAIVDWKIEPESVATITPGNNNTAVVKAVTEGYATITATIGNISSTASVIVSNNPVIATNVSISSTSPDYYTVHVESTPNEAINQTGQVKQVSIFTWSNLGQTDIDAKVAQETTPGSGIFEQTFPVNDTPVNNYYDEASNIIINVYGSLKNGENGNMIFAGNYNYLNQQNWSEEIAVTPYSQNIGFILPTVGENNVAGTTGKNLGLEGFRLSTPIEGIQLLYDVHVENLGWMDQVASGTYAGTMHQNLQLEAVHISLTGLNAQNYSVQYQVYIQNLGWQDWVSDGHLAGTTGQNLNIEAIAIQIVPNGTPLPENNR